MPTGKEKLGKGPAKIDPRTLKLFHYFTEVLAPPPPNVDYTMGITDWGMMLNGPNSYGPPIPGEGLGDCTIAAPAHAEQVWSAARGGEYTLPDMAVLQKYEQWDGYVAGDDSTDQGGIILDVLNKWRKGTFWEHPLFAYADPAPENLKHICQAIFLFGGVSIGIQLPLSVQGLSTWDVSEGSNAVPGSWGGHNIFVCGYRTNPDGTITFVGISWGGIVEITQAFWLYNDPANGPYIDEVHALIAPEFLSLKTGDTPAGLDMIALEKDLSSVTG